jgi:CubicO group peptidase (beta-lactamase class C family)
MARVHEMLGELEFHHAELVEVDLGGRTSRVLHAYARGKGRNRWSDLQFRIEPAPPYRMTELVFIAEVAEPVYLPNGDITDSATLAWLDDYVDRLVARNDLSGSLLIARGDSVLFERYFGYADVKRTRRVDAGTRFNLGSGNKMFTAIGIAQLIERGKLELGDPFGPFVPGFADSAFARRVTLGRLLSHTSGIREYWTREYAAARPALESTKDLLPWINRAGTEFEPGTRRQYSNSNYALAGLVLERASGEDYHRYVREHVCAPLGMERTESYRFGDATVPLAEPLERDGEGWRTRPQSGRGSSAGGGYSTCRDMLKFARGLVSGRLVSRETLAWMTASSPVGEPGEFDCGYGFLLEREGGVRSFGHGGIASGVNFELRHYPDLDLTFVAFSNQDNGAYDDLRRNVQRLVTGAR